MKAEIELQSRTKLILYFRIPHKFTLFAPHILHKLLFSNALGDTAYSQEHLKTMVYAKFGGQTKCIMGNSKIENWGIVTHHYTMFIPQFICD